MQNNCAYEVRIRLMIRITTIVRKSRVIAYATPFSFFRSIRMLIFPKFGDSICDVIRRISETAAKKRVASSKVSGKDNLAASC
jgi:hypothetical protein